MPLPSQPDSHTGTRSSLRQTLQAHHLAWLAQPQAEPQQAQLAAHLRLLLDTLEPECLGLYWPLKGEVDVRSAGLSWAQASRHTALALPWAQAGSGIMVFHRWQGQMPDSRDGCGIPSPRAAEVVPDVLVVPCVGVTRQGWRLGHGGGYYDRYLTKHPHITSIGVAWSHAVLDDEALRPEAHDQAMTLVVTPEGVLASG